MRQLPGRLDPLENLRLLGVVREDAEVFHQPRDAQFQGSEGLAEPGALGGSEQGGRGRIAIEETKLDAIVADLRARLERVVQRQRLHAIQGVAEAERGDGLVLRAQRRAERSEAQGGGSLGEECAAGERVHGRQLACALAKRKRWTWKNEVAAKLHAPFLELRGSNHLR
ncbi:MAG: hypothetical protein WDN28_29780 [Chthoniobacter sp.]